LKAPPGRIGAGLEYNRGRWHADVDLTRSFRQDRTASLETATPGHTMLAVGLGYRYRLSRATVDLSLRASNLLDEDARRHTSFLKQQTPLPGRNVMLGLRLGF